MAKHKTTGDLDTADDRIFTTAEVLERVPVDRTTLWKMCRDGWFPKPIRVTPGRNGWRQSRVLAWMEEREQDPIAQRAYFGRARRDDRSHEGGSGA